MWNLPEGHERLSVARWRAGCGFTSARTRIRWSFTCLVCVSVTTTRACPPRTRHHCNRRPHCSHRRSDCEDGFTKLMCYSFGSQHSGTCTRQHSCVFVLFGWIPKHVREYVMAIHAGRKMLQLICFTTMFTCHFHCICKLLWGRVTIGNDLAELSGRQVPTCSDPMHECAFSRVSCGEG